MSQIHPNAVVDDSAFLAEGVTIGPNCVVGKDVEIGEGTVLDANVVIGPGVKIGRGNRLFPNAVVGTMPQILGAGADTKIGGVIIGDNNTIREQATIHPSMYPGENTVIGNENLLMIGVHIGHDCKLEDKMVLSNYVQISGHCNIGTGVWLSGMVLSHQFVTIGRWCYAAGLTGINHDIPPFVIVSGHYPPRVRGVNKRGLNRAGLNEEQKEKVMDAFRHLYRSGGTLLGNAKALVSDEGVDDNVREMAQTIINSSEHRYGRYLENYRH